MRYPIFLVLPFVLGASRSLVFGIQSPSKHGVRRTLPAEAEYEALLIVIFCLIGLFVTLSLTLRFPALGALLEEYNQF
jgi:hypothetical protein